MPHSHSGPGQSLVLLALLWTPLALVALNRVLSRLVAWKEAATATRAALMLMLVSAIIHGALIPDHTGDPARAALFGLDAAALLMVVLAALARLSAWRQIARLLLASAVGAYIYYVGVGWESIDALGLFTKLVELAAIGLLWLPRPQLTRPLQRRVG